MAIAFFDLDRTLISKNSASLWVRSELRNNEISTWEALRAGAWLLRYRMGFANMEDAVRRAISSLEGKEEGPIKDRTFEFYEREVQGLYRPGAHAVLRQHRAAGDELVLLTSSSSYMSEKVSETLRLDGYLCTSFEVNETGHYTGRPVEPLCYGEGKLILASAYAEKRSIPLSDCFFYTDSLADIAMLRAVGQPVVVNPDPRLMREAKQRGWEIVDWGQA